MRHTRLAAAAAAAQSDRVMRNVMNDVTDAMAWTPRMTPNITYGRPPATTTGASSSGGSTGSCVSAK